MELIAEKKMATSSIRCDVSLLPRIVLLSRAAQQVLWFMLWRQDRGAKIAHGGFMKVKYKECQQMCGMQSPTHPYMGINDLLDAGFIERGPVGGWYRIAVEGIGLSED